MTINNTIFTILSNQFVNRKDLIKKFNGKFINERMAQIDHGEYKIYFRFSKNESNNTPNTLIIYQKYKSLKSNRTVKDLILDVQIDYLMNDKVRFTFIDIDHRANELTTSVINCFKKLNF